MGQQCPSTAQSNLETAYVYVLAWACLDAAQTYCLLSNLYHMCWTHIVFRLNVSSADSLPLSQPPADSYASAHDDINRRGNNATVRRSWWILDLTFGFVVGKLMVGEAKPSLLEVLHSKPVSPLCSLYHKSEEKRVTEIPLKPWRMSSSFSKMFKYVTIFLFLWHNASLIHPQC